MKTVAAVCAVAALSIGSAAGAQPTRPVDDYLLSQEVPRFALAIGVQHYDFLDPVPNALNDLSVAAQALRRAGFTTVIEVPDPTMAALETGIGQLLQLADGQKRPAVIAIFFAGHGFQNDADNYIVAKDAKLQSLVSGSVPMGSVVSELAPRHVGITFLFLDACRTLALSRGNLESGVPASPRPVFRPGTTFDGAVMSFAPGFNQAALSKADEAAVNSPYTEGLQLHLNSQGESVAAVLDKVYRHVRIRTGNRQQPATQTQASTTTIRFMPVTARTELDSEQRHWQAVVESNRRECVEDFLLSFPYSRFAISALKWLAETPPSPPHGSGGSQCPQR